MRQLLLRVPESVHARIAARAAREGRSINAVATEIIDAAADADRGDRGTRLRAQAAASGALLPVPSRRVSKAERRRILESAKGLGPIADRLIDEQRDRL
jgi:plasmid stability protein